MPRTDLIWQRHQQLGRSIYPLGHCSRQSGDLFKVEGYTLMTEEQVQNHLLGMRARWLQHGNSFDLEAAMAKLRALP